jgi:hypothetical protein
MIVGKECIDMSDPISGVSAVQAAPQPTEVRPKAPPEPQSQPVPTDTVQLSRAALAALEEATETSAQTAKEARGGDLQAKKLLAKQAAAKAALAETETTSATHVVA